MAKKPTVKAATVKLKPALELTAAGPLKTELMSLRGRAVRVDASEVDRVGALCLQVLLSARATWVADGASFTLGETSPAFDAGLATLGATAHFSNLDGVTP